MNVTTLASCDVSAFDDCAARWQQLADALGDCRADGCTGPAASLDLAWLGEAADSAKAELAGHAKGLATAADAAEAIAAALRTAANGFRTAQGRLRQALRQAPGVGVRIEQNGRAVPLPGREPEKRDITELTQLAQGALRAAAQTDQALADALLRHSRPVLTKATGAPGGTVPVLKAAGTRITGWWHGLNPVDRAFLWQHAGTELHSAGVLGPATQPKFDIGSGKHGAWTALMEKSLPKPGAQLLAQVASAIPRAVNRTFADIGDLLNSHWAADNLRHYDGNSGQTKPIDVEHLLANDAGLRQKVDDLLADHGPSWKREAIEAFRDSGGQPVLLEKKISRWHGHTADSWDDWFAIGSYQYTLSGLVKAVPDADGNPKVSVDYQVHVADRYNWNNFGSSPTVDFFHGIPHRYGLSQEYDMRGTSKLRSHPLD